MSRLPAPMGLLIDRDRPLNFRFEGRDYQGFVGDTIASALAAAGQWTLSRSFKYHRPRAVMSMACAEANTLVQLPGDPNVLADERAIEDLLEVTAQNVNGSLAKDRDAHLEKLSRFMPVGFYYRAFYKPRGVWKHWEPLIRRKAGLGVLDLDQRRRYHDKAYWFCDLAVVGAGPAGICAALTAADAGLDVVLIERESMLGGALGYARFSRAANEAMGLRERLLREVETNPNIRVMTSAVCNGWFADNYLPVIKGNRLYKLRAKRCVLATGTFEQPVVFRGNDLPGVMLTSAAQRLMRLYAVKPGGRAVVLCGNDDGYLNALELHEQGVEVSALVDMRERVDDPALSQALTDVGIAVFTGHTVFEAFASPGRDHLEAVDLRRIVGRGVVARESSRIECDLLCMSAGYMPAYQLACQAGGRLRYDDDGAAFAIEGLPETVALAGSVNGLESLESVFDDGRRAGSEAARALGIEVPLSAVSSVGRRSHYAWPIFAHPKGKEFVDFDEDLQIMDIVNATRHGYRDIQLVKRFSTVGMGPSQGRHSALATARLVAEATGRSVGETGVSTARPPFVAETLAHLAGRGFDPYRQTPMHRCHLVAGAYMIPAGNWLRPGYYVGDGVADGSDRERWVREEVRQVREGVAMIDVSTLGGLEIRGPDAVELMQRMYTFGFAKQAVGRTRYALMTDEQGVVIDDGVACRLSERHFYVTATTGGVDRVYRQMLKWNAQWRLDVDIANVTSAWAAVNLAGPDSRRVLERLESDIALDAESFPYLGVREGRLNGVPARLMRVGFVGELGFEIHVPARYGEWLWETLMRAGEPEGIRPFGVDAQRLLRLEKGHLIIGQDTDGMTHPAEIGMQWALGRNKPFFVGQRSIDILEARPPQRRLVAFCLDKGIERPLEGHLVLESGDITGHVTSCEFSPTLDRTIGLAYASPAQAAQGQRLTIKVEGGRIVEAEIVALPFYDPQHYRQEL